MSQNKLDAVSAEHLKGVGGIPWNGLWVDLSVNLTWNQLCQGLDTLKTEKANMHVQRAITKPMASEIPKFPCC